MQKINWNSYRRCNDIPGAMKSSSSGGHWQCYAPENSYYRSARASNPHFHAWYWKNGHRYDFPGTNPVYLQKGTFIDYADTDIYYHPNITKYRVFQGNSQDVMQNYLP